MVTIRSGAQPSKRRNKRGAAIANLLIVVGVLLGMTVAGLFGYGQMEERRYEEESAQRRQAFEAERLALAEQQAAAMAAVAAVERERSALLDAPLPSFPNQAPAASQRQSAAPALARRIIIPAIGVDSEVVESEIKNGEWVVPKFVVGHLQGTGTAKTGNAVFSGHLQSISSGNVFERLGDLRPGDQIYLLTTEGQYLYVVDKIKVVQYNDLSVVQPTTSPAVTLITCTGTWDVATRNYLQRLIVTGQLYKDTPPSRLPVQPR